MQEFVLIVHRYLRFVILALGILGILRTLVSLGTREAKFMSVDLLLSRVYTGALYLQLAVGLILLLVLLGAAQPVTWIHTLLMIPAVFIGHLSRRYRHWEDRDRHTVLLRIYVGSLGIIVIGLIVINQLRLI